MCKNICLSLNILKLCANCTKIKSSHLATKNIKIIFFYQFNSLVTQLKLYNFLTLKQLKQCQVQQSFKNMCFQVLHIMYTSQTIGGCLKIIIFDSLKVHAYFPYSSCYCPYIFYPYSPNPLTIFNTDLVLMLFSTHSKT